MKMKEGNMKIGNTYILTCGKNSRLSGACPLYIWTVHKERTNWINGVAVHYRNRWLMILNLFMQRVSYIKNDS